MIEGMGRALDIGVSAALLIVSAPLWLVLAVAVRLSSRGPVLYAATRIGRYGHPFAMYKFRSMRQDAEKCGPGITAANDPRITRVGGLLRATKLDEIPQLINVLRGEMSLVGPRPEAPEYVALYDSRQRGVLAVRPGITGAAQLFYRHEQEMLSGDNVELQYRTQVLPAKLEIDLIYVRQRSLSRDLRLLFLTARRLFTRSRTLVAESQERRTEVGSAPLGYVEPAEIYL